MPETRAALQLMALLYPRPRELRQADWSEFDLERAIWTIPSSRTKMRREHRKPLSQLAITILRDLHRAAYWDERTRMAEWWASEIDAMRAETDAHQKQAS